VEDKKDKFFDYLMSQSDRFENDIGEFNYKIRNLLSNPVDNMGIILKCNLIIEKYIDDYLEIAYPTINFDLKDRLTYNQKIELINNPRTNFYIFLNGAKELNSIRNKYAHNLNYEIQNSTFKEVKEIMTFWNTASGKKQNEGIQLVVDFTATLCMFLFSTKNEIKVNGSGLGLPKYLEWVEKIVGE
jgi:hypothetical protein